MKIWVLSRNPKLYSTERLVEAGIRMGHDVQVIDYLTCNIMIDKGKPCLYVGSSQLELPDAIIPRIGASRTFYGSAVVRQFEMLGVFTTVKSQAIVRSRDKLRSMQILSRHNIDMPHTAFAATPEDIKVMMKQVGGPPIIIKLLEGTQGNGVVLAETYNAAKSALDAFFGLKANILVQEFIKEANGRDIRVLIVGDRVVASMARQSTKGEFRSNLHQGGYAQKVRLTKAERQIAIDAAKALGLSICGVDLLQSERGPLVMEVNSSPGLEGIEKSTGVNVADKIFTYIESNVHRKIKNPFDA
ncbi:MAG: 30S ribosomal protein S6--L-glutamate ligase [Bacteroidota bacterium]|nr:30S ribosomal protein S6--L-glutamate ligase [Bacteroidota bacterium]